MKKFVKYLLAFFTAFLVCFTVSCSNNSSNEDNGNGNTENPETPDPETPDPDNPNPEIPDKPVAKKFNVNFYVNDDLYEVVVTNDEGYIEKTPEDPVVEGCNFNGWYLDLEKGIEFSKATKLEKDTNVYAKLFNIENNKLDINIKGATLEHDEAQGDYYKITMNNTVERIDLLDIVEIKSECEFKVYVLINGELKNNNSQGITLKPGLNKYIIEVINSIDEKASYKLDVYRNKTYKITLKNTYNMPNGNIRKVEEGTVLDNLETPVRTGYTFTGWSYDFTQPINSDLTVEALWEQTIYHINLDTKGGKIEGSDVIDVTYNSEVTYPKAYRYGYKFRGWQYDGLAAPTLFRFEKDINVYATWEKETYKITYQNNLLYDNPSSNPKTFTCDDTVIKFENPSKVGHTFKGWLVNDSTTPIKDLTLENKNYTSIYLVAVFEADTYTITLENGNDSNIVEVTYGEPYDFPFKLKENYTFDGYYSFETGCLTKGDYWTYIGDRTLTATYSPNKYTITFVDGLTGNTTKEYYYNSTGYTCKVPSYGYEKKFQGYYTKPNGEGEKIFNSDGSCVKDFTFTEDFEVYPLYEYLFFYYDNKGYEGNIYLLPSELETFTPKDKTNFESWYIDEKLTKPIDTSNLVGNTIIYAKYKGETSPEILNFEIQKNKLTITGITDKTITDLVLPEYIGGKKVEVIADAAFQDIETLINLVLPDTLTNIGYRVFTGCNHIKNIKTPFIGEYLNSTFDFRSPIGHFFGPNGNVNQQYGSDEMHANGYNIPLTIENITVTQQTIFPYGAFQSITSLLHVTIRDDTTEIGNFAFKDCVNLQTLNSDVNGEINFPSACKVIPGYAFQNDDKITKVKINRRSQLTVGSYAFDKCSNLTSFNTDQPNKIYTENSLIDAIGAFAFQDCKLIKDVEIGNAITLGKGFLSGLDNLQILQVPFVGSKYNQINTYDSTLGYFFKPGYSEGNCRQEYSQGSSYENYFVPETLTDVIVTSQSSFGCGTFENFKFLENIEIPSTVTEIGDRFLNGCVALQRFNSTNYGEINIPTYIKVLPYKTFNNCITITKINAPTTITTIGNYAFANCTSLTSINNTDSNDILVPSFVESIGEGAFYKLPNIKSVYVPTKVKEIGESAFLGMDSLKSITLPFVGQKRNLVNTKNSTFGWIFFDYNGTTYQYYKDNTPMHCSIPNLLRTITITDQEEFGNGVFHNLANVERISVPETTYLMGNRICQGCNNLTGFNNYNGNARLPNISRIGDYFFEKCYQLHHISFTDSVKEIGKYAFSNCYNVKGINNMDGIQIGPNIEVIGDYAFNNIELVTDIYFITNVLSSFGIGVFSDCSSLKHLTIPYIGQRNNLKYGTEASIGYLFKNSTKGVETDCYYEKTNGYNYSYKVYYPANLYSIHVYQQTTFSRTSFSYMKSVKELYVNRNANLTQEMVTNAACGATLSKSL